MSGTNPRKYQSVTMSQTCRLSIPPKLSLGFEYAVEWCICKDKNKGEGVKNITYKSRRRKKKLKMRMNNITLSQHQDISGKLTKYH